MAITIKEIHIKTVIESRQVRDTMQEEYAGKMKEEIIREVKEIIKKRIQE
ncbi:MAG: hypothetical protein LUE98_20240 [Tannerellaceae bacterium]|nr:hypothetical protein [Tannerellaceae bacterium]